MDERYPLKAEWEEQYIFLENLRKSGVTNMFGATPYLEEAFSMDYAEAGACLVSWIANYDELNERFGWQK